MSALDIAPDTLRDAAAVLPRLHALNLRAEGNAAIWRRCDMLARLQWCRLARIDSDRPLSVPWESLSEAERKQLALVLCVMLNFLRRVGELHAEARAA